MTSDTGAWRQATCNLLAVSVHEPIWTWYGIANASQGLKYDSRNDTAVLCLDSIAVMDENRVAVFALSCDLDEDMEITCNLRQFEGRRIARHIVFVHDDLEAIYTEATPRATSHRRQRCVTGWCSHCCAQKKSWNVITLENETSAGKIAAMPAY